MKRGKIGLDSTPTRAGGGERRAIKWGMDVGGVSTPPPPCLGSLPARRFKIPLEMAQATPAL